MSTTSIKHSSSIPYIQHTGIYTVSTIPICVKEKASRVKVEASLGDGVVFCLLSLSLAERGNHDMTQRGSFSFGQGGYHRWAVGSRWGRNVVVAWGHEDG